MRLAMSTCCHGRVLRRPEVYYSCEQALKVCADSGFSIINMDFIEYSHPGQPMSEPGWQSWCQHQREVADELSLDVAYAHAPFYTWSKDKPEGDDYYEEMIRRSIIGAGIMGVRYMVFHPGSIGDDIWYSQSKSKEWNIRFYNKYAEQCAYQGIKVVIENMMEPTQGRRFCSGIEELLDLYETLNDPIYGICWDFGHAHMAGINQSEALRALGKRLTMLHVNDNFGIHDDHLAPFFGTIQWKDIMGTLGEIKYDGDFIFENFSFFDGLPDVLRITLMRFCHDLGEYMQTLIDN